MNLENSGEIDSPGARFNRILDECQFPRAKRPTKLCQYLRDAMPDEYAELNYGTVRSWLDGSVPRTKDKMKDILNALQQQYTFSAKFEESVVVNYWRLGGYNPFEASIDTHKILDEFHEENEKLDTRISYMIVKCYGEDFDSINNDNLNQLKEIAKKLAKDFADPRQRKCPDYLLELVLLDAIKRSLDPINGREE